jgi:malonyl-CoA/methylmalonyl-CoA synthetase
MDDLSPRTVRAWSEHLRVTPGEVDPPHLRRELKRGSIPGVLTASARYYPDAVLSVDDVCLSRTQLAASVSRCASVLGDHGMSHGSRIVINARSSMALVVAYLGALSVGGVVVLANPTYTASELTEVVDRARASVLLVDDGDGDRESSVQKLRMGDLAAAADGATEHPLPEVSSDDVALLAFTSGTTGSPKVVPLTHGELLASIRAAMQAWGWSSADTLVHALPLFHQHGLSGIHASLIAGSSAVILSSSDPERLMQAVERARGTVLFGVPSIHQRLIDLEPEALAPMRQLRLVTSGSGPLPAALAREFREKTGIEPLERYGLTESGLNVSNPYFGKRVPGTVGTPLPGVEVVLRDQIGTPVESGTSGEITLRGPQIFSGYLDDPEATDEAFWPDGWFRTGDLGRWNEDDRLVITGRLKELIITGGMNVVPQEVERVIERFRGVAAAAVAGIRSDRWGEEVAAWVVPTDSGTLEPEDLIAFTREHLAAYKCPKRVYVVTDLPRNAMGKLIRRSLAGTVDQ